MGQAITIIIFAFFVIGYFHQYNLRHKAEQKLKKTKRDMKIPYEDYSRYQNNSVVFFRYLADLREKEKSSVHLINKIIDKFDTLIFEECEQPEFDSSAYCECENHKENDLKHGYCTECKRIINIKKEL